MAERLPLIYRFCYLAYSNNTFLRFGDDIITSQEGAQQGDPLGPLLFCLAVHPLLSSLTCPLVVGYMDDITLGGPMDLLADDMERIHRDGALFGLHINNSKSEIIANSEPFSNGFTNSGFQFTAPTAATLLGAA